MPVLYCNKVVNFSPFLGFFGRGFCVFPLLYKFSMPPGGEVFYGKTFQAASRRTDRLGAVGVISCHGHGGQIRLNLNYGLVSTDRTNFPSYTGLLLFPRSPGPASGL